MITGYLRLVRVVWMALRIRLAAMSGWAMNAACDPSLTDSTLAFIRLAMNRWQSGGQDATGVQLAPWDGSAGTAGAPAAA